LTPVRFAGQALVTGDDVLAAPAAEPTTRPDATGAGSSRQESMRRHIAELMTRSWREIPHYHLGQRLDLSTAVDRLQAANEHRPLPERIVPGALLLCAAARAVAAVPQCNGWWREGRFEPSGTVDLGLVLSLRTGGIIVPTIGRADELSPAEMMRRMTELVQQARQGRLRSSHLGEASVTVTSLGDRGADAVMGLIHPPQVALIGFGAVRDELWPEPDADSDGFVVRPTVHATLAGDHRATDGVVGSRVLARMQMLLDGPLAAELESLEGGT
jgi:pyruvate dehydrogenase E2 component (dihydrolipoamide acetyltransferase)